MPAVLEPPDERPANIRLPGGVTVPISRWAVSVFSLVAIVAIGFGVYRYFYPVEPELVTLKQANDQLAFTMKEFGLHLGEVPIQQWKDTDADLTVSLYRDHCVLIQRSTPATGIRTRLIPDLTREPEARAGLALMPTLYAAGAGGQCLNPHPGPFETKTEQLDRCTVKVWRFWPDSCAHWQLYSACNNSWETNRDGSPLLHWERCVH